METDAIKLDVHVAAWSHEASSLPGLLSNVIINIEREMEEFIIDENDDDRVTSLGSYSDSSSPPDPLIFLKLQNFKPDNVYQHLQSTLHDHVLSQVISDQIVFKAQRLTSQSFEPLFMVAAVKLTQKVYSVVPRNSAPSTTELESEEEEEEEVETTKKTCAICLENLLGGSEKNCQMPNCSHWFHEECLIEWLDRDHNSCPLCRQSIYLRK